MVRSRHAVRKNAIRAVDGYSIGAGQCLCLHAGILRSCLSFLRMAAVFLQVLRPDHTLLIHRDTTRHTVTMIEPLVPTTVRPPTF